MAFRTMEPEVDNQEKLSGESEERVVSRDIETDIEEVGSDDELEICRSLEAWKEAAKERPLGIMVCGLGGVGKSTLVNRLLRTEGNEKWAIEGIGGGATTVDVKMYQNTNEHGIKICVFDSPGFDDANITYKDIIRMLMNAEIKGKVDLLFYCISLEGKSPRVKGSDIQAIKIMTKMLGHAIWEKALIVLTFANELEELRNKDDYFQIIADMKKEVQQKLREVVYVSDEIVDQVPMITAGFENPVLKYEADECKSMGGWLERLFITSLKLVDPEKLPSFFEVRHSWKKLGAAMSGGGVGGALVCAGVGAGIGAAIGTVGGPLGVGICAAIGAGIGGGSGLIGGVSIGGITMKVMLIKNILKVKFKMWKARHGSTKEEK